QSNDYSCGGGGGGGAWLAPAVTPTPTPAPPVLWSPQIGMVQSGQTQTVTVAVDNASAATVLLGWADDPTETLDLTLGGRQALVTASLELQSSSDPPTTIALIEQPGGVYTTAFAPAQEGTYVITLYARGTNNSGQAFKRSSVVLLQASSAAELTGGYTEHANP